MSDQTLPIKFADCVEFVIPEFDVRPAITLSFNEISEGENRLVEARAVNGATYAELESVFSGGWREARNNRTVVGYEIAQAKKILRRIKSEYILDEYQVFLKESKIKDSTAIREAWLEKKEDYKNAMDRVDMLVALSELLENKLKVFENVSRYMKKEMDILIRSGFTGNKYSSR